MSLTTNGNVFIQDCTVTVLNDTAPDVIEQGSDPSPPAITDESPPFYHAVKTDRLYVLQDDGVTRRWVNTTGPQLINNDVVYYVDSLNGSDSNDGSQASPFQTFEFAYSLLSALSYGKCRINLIGTGPYALPTSLRGVIPMGAAGEPLLICGDAMTQVFTGTVTSISASGAGIAFGGVIAQDAYRGLVYHGLTGSSANKFYQIANNTPTELFSIGNTFNAVAGDTFEILQPVTQLSGSNLSISGPGKIGFWRCELHTANLDIVANASTLFDACILVPTGRLSGRLQSCCQFLPVASSSDFSVITDAGTQAGKTGLFFNSSVVFAANAIRMFDGSRGTGYLISRGGLYTFTGGQWFLFGTDIDVTGGVNSAGIVAHEGAIVELNTGYHRLVLGGLNGVGLAVSQNAFMLLINANTTITQAGSTAIQVSGGGVLEMKGVSGSAGNGFGVLVLDNGMLTNIGSNTVTGINGDVRISPSAAAIPWAKVPSSCFSDPSGSNALRTPVADANYLASVTDQLIAYPTLSAPRTVTLPDPATTGATGTYIKRVKVQDESGNAGAQPITLSPAVGAIHGNAVINTPYGHVSVYTQGTAWFVE